VLTPRRYWQILSAWLQIWECRGRVGKQVIKVNIAITQSDTNTDMAYKNLQRFQLRIMFFRKTWFTQIPIKRNGFTEHKYYISSPGQGVRLPLRVGVSSSCHNNKFDTGLSPSCLTSGWQAVIVWFEVFIFGNIMDCIGTTVMKLNCQGTAYIQ
jgi:hypothetical protein